MTACSTVELQALGKHHYQGLNNGRVTLNDMLGGGGGEESYYPTTRDLVGNSAGEASESPFRALSLDGSL
jgi:hypothetical protein